LTESIAHGQTGVPAADDDRLNTLRVSYAILFLSHENGVEPYALKNKSVTGLSSYSQISTGT
jgi:hypothetical protein